MNRIFLLVLWPLILSVQTAYSCGCIPKTFEERIADTDYIFVGKVVAVKAETPAKKRPDEARKYIVKLRVIENFKGVKTKYINIVQHEISYGTSCPAWNLEQGETYLIYAGGKKNDIRHYVACAPTQKFNANSSDYIDLREYRDKKTKKEL